VLGENLKKKKSLMGGSNSGEEVGSRLEEILGGEITYSSPLGITLRRWRGWGIRISKGEKDGGKAESRWGTKNDCETREVDTAVHQPGTEEEKTSCTEICG